MLERIFRDQNLQTSVVVDKDDGEDDPADYVLLKRGKRHDYFTSCLPWAQKGTAVSIPLGSTAPVISSGTNMQVSSTGNWNDKFLIATNTPSNSMYVSGGATGAYQTLKWGTDTGLSADLSTATAATINSLRQAFQIQRLYERDARGGTRYIEMVRSHFGVVSPDARQQRPEYLGGGSAPITVTPIPQTSSTDATSLLVRWVVTVLSRTTKWLCEVLH